MSRNISCTEKICRKCDAYSYSSWKKSVTEMTTSTHDFCVATDDSKNLWGTLLAKH